MRKLKTSDVFKMSKILKKMNLKLEIEDTASQMQAGVYFMQKIAENVHLAEEEVSEFLGDLVGKTGAEFSEMDLEESMKVIEQFKKQKGLTSFFKLASK